MASVDELHEPSYQTDSVSAEADQMFRRHFGKDTESYFVFNGTAANVLALSSLVQSHHSVICSSQAHIAMDECGAPEKLLGCKLLMAASPDGKLTPELIRPFLVRRGDQHFSQPKVISITQPTEVGTVYSVEEIQAIVALAKKENLLVHMDGSRFVNAAFHLGVSFREMSTDLGIDVLSLGGTKNAMLFGEAVLILNPQLGKDLKFTRKQFMQLPSKTRYLAAQFIEFLDTDLWRLNAEHSMRHATQLSDGLRQIKFVHVTQKTQSNGVFVCFPRPWIGRLKKQAFFYIWDESPEGRQDQFECRLMTSWDTNGDDIENFLKVCAELASESTHTKII